jgi:WD40 repeat protein
LIAAVLATSIGLTVSVFIRWHSSGDQSGPNLTAAPEHASVLLFDVPRHRVHAVPMPSDAAYARWVKPGETFIARGSSDRPDDYTIYSTDGQRVLTPFLQDRFTSDVVPAPDGSALLVGRTDDQYLVSEFPSGNGPTMLTSVANVAFSPDGKRMAYLALGGSDQEGVNHDWRHIYINDKNELSGFAGAGLSIASEREADGLIDLVRQPWSPDVQPWSPDGKSLLAVDYAPCGAGAPINCHGIPSFEVYTTQLTANAIWRGYPGRLQSAVWAGPRRLFVTFFPDAEHDPDYPDAASLFVDIGATRTPAPAVLQGTCCVSFSPDGRSAIVRHLNPETGRQRCSLVDAVSGDELEGIDATEADIYVFCGSVSWTGDGSRALVSSAFGN